MKTCRKGLHQYEPVVGSTRGCYECKMDYLRKWKTEHPEKVAQSIAKHQAKNQDKYVEYKRKWAAKNLDKNRESSRKYDARNRELKRSIERERIATMSNSYIRKLIPGVHNPPQELIEAKRRHLKLHRLLKEMK